MQPRWAPSAMKPVLRKEAFITTLKARIALARLFISYCREADLQACKEAPFYKLTDPLARVMGRLDFAAKFCSDKSSEASGRLLIAFAHDIPLYHLRFR